MKEEGTQCEVPVDMATIYTMAFHSVEPFIQLIFKVKQKNTQTGSMLLSID